MKVRSLLSLNVYFWEVYLTHDVAGASPFVCTTITFGKFESRLHSETDLDRVKGEAPICLVFTIAILNLKFVFIV